VAVQVVCTLTATEPGSQLTEMEVERGTIVNMTDVESSKGDPVATTADGPETINGTVIEHAEKEPSDAVHDPTFCPPNVIAIEVSVVEKSEPLTVVCEPSMPEVGESEI
jgi:hypothetical protein